MRYLGSVIQEIVLDYRPGAKLMLSALEADIPDRGGLDFSQSQRLLEEIPGPDPVRAALLKAALARVDGMLCILLRIRDRLGEQYGKADGRWSTPIATDTQRDHRRKTDCYNPINALIKEN